MSQFAQIEAEAAFEQDQRNADPDGRLHQVAECRIRIEQAKAEFASHGAGEEARGEHQDDCRPARPPSKPLRPDTEDANRGDDKCLRFHELSRLTLLIQ